VGGAVPETSAAGRWFDAATGLLGVVAHSAFEAEAPMRLEALATDPSTLAGGWRIEGGVLDLDPLLGRIAETADQREGANLFHGTFAAALADWVMRAADAQNLRTVALGGGCFLNRTLTGLLQAQLEEAGLRVLLPRQAPFNDGGLSLGQAYVAALSDLEGEHPCA
jgi:hydrogenase maturation protein HypF